MTAQTEQVNPVKRLRYRPVAVALAGFLAVSFVVYVVWRAMFPQWAMRYAWAPLLPSFEWLSPGALVLGLAETVIYGFWLALVVPIANCTNRLLASS